MFKLNITYYKSNTNKMFYYTDQSYVKFWSQNHQRSLENSNFQIFDSYFFTRVLPIFPVKFQLQYFY